MAKKEKLPSARIEKPICCECGKSKSLARDFYISSSNIYKYFNGRLPICKDCFVNKFNEYKLKYDDDMKALYLLCMNFDILFSKDLYLSSVGNGNLLSDYMRQLNSLPQYRGKTGIHSDCIILDESILEKIENDIEKEVLNIEINNEIRSRWGMGYSDDECIFLENIYKEFTDVYESRTPAQRLIFRNMAKSTLEGDKALRNGQPNVFEKMQNVVSKLMTDGNIKPIQEASIAEDDTATWGKWINLIEQDRPIGEPLDQFKDVDKISSYITKWFTKQMQRVFDLNTGDDDDNQN